MESRKQRVDRVINDFLGGEVRSDELHEMVEALSARLEDRRNELSKLASGSADWDVLQAELKELEKQVLVLKREEAITQFVEDSVKMTLSTSEMLEGGEEMELNEEDDWKPSGFPELDEE